MNPEDRDSLEKKILPIMKKLSFYIGANVLAGLIINKTLKMAGSTERVGFDFYSIVRGN